MLFSFSLTQIISLLTAYRYIILFPFVVFEGPIITVIAALLASLGYLNIFLVYAVVVIGDVTGDCIYYAIGRWGGKQFIARWGKYIGINLEKINQLENCFKKNGKKILIIGKLTHAVGIIVLTTAGIAKMNIKDFILFNFIPTLPKSLFLIILGFYFGQTYTKINSYLSGFTFFTILILALIFIAYLMPKIFRKLIPEIQ